MARGKAEKKQNKSYKFDRKSKDKNAPDEGAEVAGRAGMKSLLNEDPVADADRPAGDQKDHGGKRHDPQAADLDQEEDDPPARGSEILRRVLDGQTGNAEGRGRGEQGVDVGDPAGGRAPGKRKEQRTDKDSDQKADGQNLSRLEELLFRDGRSPFQSGEMYSFRGGLSMSGGRGTGSVRLFDNPHPLC